MVELRTLFGVNRQKQFVNTDRRPSTPRHGLRTRVRLSEVMSHPRCLGIEGWKKNILAFTTKTEPLTVVGGGGNVRLSSHGSRQDRCSTVVVLVLETAYDTRGEFSSVPVAPAETKYYLGNLEEEGGSRALGGCLGHAAERQSCLQRDVINYSETALKGTQCGRWSRCRPASSLSERDFTRNHTSSLSSARGRLYNANAAMGTGLPCVFF